MDRRGFLKGLAAVIGGIALNEAVPLGRVWSFPKQIKFAKNPFDYSEHLDRALHSAFTQIGSTIPIKMPPRFMFRDELVDYFNPPKNLMEMYRAGIVGRVLTVEVDEERNVTSSLAHISRFSRRPAFSRLPPRGILCAYGRHEIPARPKRSHC